jgi:hypothetical protein
VIIADNCGAIRRFAGDSAKYYADALYCYPIYRAALSPRPAKASAINKHQRASERASESNNFPLKSIVFLIES